MSKKTVIPIMQPSYFHKKEPAIRDHIARCVAAAILKHHIEELFEITKGVDRAIRRALRANLVSAPEELKTYEFYDRFWGPDHRLDIAKMTDAMTRASEEFEEYEDSTWRAARRERLMDIHMEEHIEKYFDEKQF